MSPGSGKAPGTAAFNAAHVCVGMRRSCRRTEPGETHLTPGSRAIRSSHVRVSIRDLRNHGGDIVERAAGGEAITITRAGTPVAQLQALPARPVSAEQLLERWSRLPRVDADALRADIDKTLDARL